MNNLFVEKEQKETSEWDEEIDLRQYWIPIAKRKWSVIGLTILIPILTTLIMLPMKSVYRSTATLLIEPQIAKLVDIEEVMSSLQDWGYYATQYEILKSRELAEQIIQRLSLETHPGFDFTLKEIGFNIDWPAWLPSDWLPSNWPLPDWLPLNWLESLEPPTGEASLHALAKVFSERLSIEPIKNSQLVEVGFEAHDAALAADVVNTLCEKYIENDREARLKATVEISSKLTEGTEDLRKKLELSEKKLQEYRERENLLDVEGVRTLTARRLDELTTQLLKASQQVSEAEAVYKQVAALNGEPIQRLNSLPAIAQDSLLQSLKAIEADAQIKVSELGKFHGLQHPKMVTAMAALEVARSSVIEQIKVIVDRIEKEYRIAQDNYASVSSGLDNAKEEMQEINRKEFQLGLLERDVIANRELYELFVNRLKETNLVEDLQSANARMVDRAVVATSPYKPDKKRALLISVVIGLVFGIIWAFLREYMDKTLKSIDDVEDKLHINPLGYLPKLKLRVKSRKKHFIPLRYFKDNPRSGFAEAIRTIRTGVLLSSLDTPRKVIVVTSSMPGEGKSTVAMNLAFALGDTAKVLLIDADMRQPSLAKACGLSESASGLSHLAAGMDKPSRCIHSIEGTRVLVIPSGIVPPNPLELLSSKRFVAMLDKLKQHFDHIVIDSPPALAVSDALVLSKYASEVILVTLADSTPYKLARTLVKRLQRANVPLAGVILNQVNLKHHTDYKAYGYGKELP